MTSPAHRHAPFTTAVALLAVTAVVVACDARIPASDELTAPDVVRGAALPESVRVPPAGAGDPAATGGMLAPAAGGGGMTVGVGSVATPEVASGGPVGTPAAPGASACC